MVATAIAQIIYRKNVVQHVGYTVVYYGNLFCLCCDWTRFVESNLCMSSVEHYHPALHYGPAKTVCRPSFIFIFD